MGLGVVQSILLGGMYKRKYLSRDLGDFSLIFACVYLHTHTTHTHTHTHTHTRTKLFYIRRVKRHILVYR